jgi:carbon storage regulator
VFLASRPTRDHFHSRPKKENRMLVVSRKINERVFVEMPDGRLIVVTISAVRGDKVRVGFDAPQDVKILREELFQAALETAR